MFSGIFTHMFGSKDYKSDLEMMISEQIIVRNIKTERVIEALRKVPRHIFVNKKDCKKAYGDHPLPIGFGQTISQPYIVALSIDALSLQGEEKVLEVGTGSGYQTALLAYLAKEVYTVERIKELYEYAKKRIHVLRLENIHYKVGDGSKGWQEHAPYDCIIVSAFAPQIPPSYIAQLKENGKIVIPVGEEYSQKLILAEKKESRLITKTLCECLFVKLIGEEGWH